METKQLNKNEKSITLSRPKANCARRAVLGAGIAALSLVPVPKAVAAQPVAVFGAVKVGARSYGGGTNTGLIAGAEAGASRRICGCAGKACAANARTSAGIIAGASWPSF